MYTSTTVLIRSRTSCMNIRKVTKAGRMGKIAIPNRNTENSHFYAWSLVNLAVLTLQLPCKNKKVKLKRLSGILGTILQIKRQLKINGICNIHARFTSLSTLMLCSEENQPNNKTFHFFSFLYGQLVNCKQFIYF